MIPDIVSGLGLGPQLTIAATLALVGVYLYRAAALASLVATLAGSAVTYVLVVLLAAAGAVAAGWVSPNPSVLFAHVSGAASAAATDGVELVRRLFEMLTEVSPI